MLRAVLDANVLVSSLITPSGNAARIVDAWRREEVVVITSPAIIAKVVEVLRRPHLFGVYTYDESDIVALQKLMEEEGCDTPGELDLRVVEEDPEDDNILIAAIEGLADCIISGDSHLKNLGRYEDIPILSPAEFVDQYHIP